MLLCLLFSQTSPLPIDMSPESGANLVSVLIIKSIRLHCDIHPGSGSGIDFEFDLSSRGEGHRDIASRFQESSESASAEASGSGAERDSLGLEKILFNLLVLLALLLMYKAMEADFDFLFLSKAKHTEKADVDTHAQTAFESKAGNGLKTPSTKAVAGSSKVHNVRAPIVLKEKGNERALRTMSVNVMATSYEVKKINKNKKGKKMVSPLPMSVPQQVPIAPSAPSPLKTKNSNSSLFDQRDSESLRSDDLLVSENYGFDVDLKKAPKVLSAGNVSLVYELYDAEGKPAAIFKPCDVITQSDTPTQDGNITISSMNEVNNEHLAYVLDQNLEPEARAGVPETRIAEIPSAYLATLVTNDDKENSDMHMITGSMQRYIRDSESCEDYGPASFLADDIHKIGLLDLRILNCDRHPGNILVAKSSRKLVPIDHALAFPSVEFSKDHLVDSRSDLKNLTLKDISFDWLLFPQAKQPFSPAILSALSKLSFKDDLRAMVIGEKNLKQRLAAFMASRLIREGIIRHKKTLYEMGMIMQRLGDRSQPSVLEDLGFNAAKGLDLNMLENGEKEVVTRFCENFNSLVQTYFSL